MARFHFNPHTPNKTTTVRGVKTVKAASSKSGLRGRGIGSCPAKSSRGGACVKGPSHGGQHRTKSGKLFY